MGGWGPGEKGEGPGVTDGQSYCGRGDAEAPARTAHGAQVRPSRPRGARQPASSHP